MRMNSRRTGFTLIEMLIVLGIIVTVASIFVPIVLNLSDRNQVAKGASMLENALHVAKARAVAERRANGVRLMLTNNNLRQLVSAANPRPGFAWYDELQYIEDPSDYVEAWLWGLADVGIQNVVQPFWSIDPAAAGPNIGPAAPSPGALPWGYDSINVAAGPFTIASAYIDSGGGIQTNRVVPRNRLLFGPITFADWVGVNPLPKGYTNPATGASGNFLAGDQYRSQRLLHSFSASRPFSVQVGDSVEITGTGEVYRVLSVTNGGLNISSTGSIQVSAIEIDRPLTTNLVVPLNGRPNFRIIRQPRVISALNPVKLPQDVVIDMTPSRINFPNVAAGSDFDTTNSIWMSNVSSGISVTDITGLTTTTANLVAPDYIDIMFAPSGEMIPTAQVFRNGTVVGQFTVGSSGFIALWVHQRGDPNLWAARSITAAQGNADNQAIVAVNARTGFIGSYPINRSTADPLALARVGKARMSADTGN